MASQPPPFRTQQKQQTQERPQNSSAPPQTQNQTNVETRPLADTVVEARANKAPGLKMEQPIATAGRSGESNIQIEKFNQWVGNNYPCGFRVRTLPGNGLEIVMEQLAYKKTYTGEGFVETGLTPIAPIGTPGKINVRDTTTGETLEQPWKWHIIGGGGGGGLGLWAMIKSLFVKAEK